MIYKTKIRIAIVVLIILHILHVLHKEQIKSESDRVVFSYVIYDIPTNCSFSYRWYRFYLPRCEELNIGDKISLSGRVESNADTAFFSQKRLLEQEIVSIQRSSSLVKHWFYYIFEFSIQVRQAFLESFIRSFDSAQSALLAGMVLGQKQAIPETIKEQIEIIGMQHVVVASGFNISIVAMAILTILPLKAPLKWLRLLMLTIVLCIYSLILGLSAPLTRALSMALLSLIASKLCRRQYRPLYTLFIVAFAMIATNPFLLFSLSFQLSFSASFGIMTIMPLFTKKEQGMAALLSNDLSSGTLPIRNIAREFKQLLIESFQTTLAAQAYTTPLILLNFQTLNINSLFANTALLWLTPSITNFGLIYLLLQTVAFFLPVFDFLLVFLQLFLALILSVFLKLLEVFSLLPFTYAIENLSFFLLLIYSLFIFTLTSFLSWRRK